MSEIISRFAVLPAARLTPSIAARSGPYGPPFVRRRQSPPVTAIELGFYRMANLDHVILKVNDLQTSVASVGNVRMETGARGIAPTLYFNDPNQHLLEIRTYDR